jgi:hypothetical protein
MIEVGSGGIDGNRYKEGRRGSRLVGLCLYTYSVLSISILSRCLYALDVWQCECGR